MSELEPRFVLVDKDGRYHLPNHLGRTNDVNLAGTWSHGYVAHYCGVPDGTRYIPLTPPTTENGNE